MNVKVTGVGNRIIKVQNDRSDLTWRYVFRQILIITMS